MAASRSDCASLPIFFAILTIFSVVTDVYLRTNYLLDSLI